MLPLIALSSTPDLFFFFSVQMFCVFVELALIVIQSQVLVC